MRAVIGPDPSDSRQLTPLLAEVPDPRPDKGEVVIDVAAAGLNHAELLQVRGLYPPPPGESAVPGLEASGTIAALGPGVRGWAVGERVMALLAGGGHATKAAVPVGQLMRVPANLSLIEAGAVPEAALTAWTNLVAEGRLMAGESVLITGATGGIGSFAVQLARELGGRVIAAGRSLERLQELKSFGIRDFGVDDEDLPEMVRSLTDGRGADLVFDLTSGPLWNAHLEALRPRGRLILIGLTAGRKAEVDLSTLLRKRLKVVGSVLRYRSREEKAELVEAFAPFGLPRLADERLRPRVAATYPLKRVAEAYEALRTGGVVGKIVLVMEPSPS
jgi:putative PIG3 family NAD(P)H quinone oxidoreductase